MAGTEDIVDAAVVLDLPDSASLTTYSADDVIWDADGNPILDSPANAPIHED